MYVYVPNSVKANPPVLLALHGCQGSGPYMYSSTDFGALADQYGFIVVYPSSNPGGSCWDVSSAQALARNGGSDPVGLMSMITYTEQHYGGNPNAVYVTGESSGGMMTNVMLADYQRRPHDGVPQPSLPLDDAFGGDLRLPVRRQPRVHHRGRRHIDEVAHAGAGRGRHQMGGPLPIHDIQHRGIARQDDRRQVQDGVHPGDRAFQGGGLANVPFADLDRQIGDAPAQRIAR